MPIDEVLDSVIAAVRDAGAVALQAPPGAGKTTRVPAALVDAGTAGAIVVLEPRRIAARAAARRIAVERGVRVGGEVGYEVRFDRQWTPRTRIRFVTEGVFLRMLQDDPFLEGMGAVVFDEFHERRLLSDLALAMARRVRREARPDLQIVAMSATLDAGPIAQFLDNCPIIVSEGRCHPVDIAYAPPELGLPIGVAAARGVARALAESSGDVLAFLPGVGEIRHAASELETMVGDRDLAIFPLYGDLSADRQDAALAPSERRRVVLATNVAETSVTVEGVEAVVDAGWARSPRYDLRVGLDRLTLVRVSKASAEQRAGRAGRERPGRCWRLWSEADQRRLSERDEPEIRRLDLAGAALELYAWGETDLENFGWFESPSPQAIADATALLERLGAVAGGGVTDRGRAMAKLPAHPRISRLLLEGHRWGATRRAALLGAILSERDPFERAGAGRRRSSSVSESDPLDALRAIEEFERSPRRETSLGPVHEAAGRFVLQARDQLARLLPQTLGPASKPTIPEDEALMRSLLAAFPDRVARRRSAGESRGVMVGGRGVRLSGDSAVHRAPLFIAVDVDAGASEAIVRQASEVLRDWLPADRVRASTDVEFDPERRRVIAWRRTRYEDLVLEEAPTSTPNEADVWKALASAAADRLREALPLDEPAIHQFLQRVAWLREWMPELGLPVIDDNCLRDCLAEWCVGCRSFDDLRKAPILDGLRGLLTHVQRQTLDREAPERIATPAGSRIALEYEPGRPPILAVRIQEMFGLATTPRLAGGRAPILLHLLAPNMRPQQVTDDLASFWKNAYPIVRKELRARYPKHAWPEDPLAASPQRRPGKPRS